MQMGLEPQQLLHVESLDRAKVEDGGATERG